MGKWEDHIVVVFGGGKSAESTHFCLCMLADQIRKTETAALIIGDAATNSGAIPRS